MRLFLLIIVITIFGCSESQTIKKQSVIIGNLETNEEVEIFIQQLTKQHDFKLIPFNSCKIANDSLLIDKLYYKADFDNNGFQDLLLKDNPENRIPNECPLFIVLNYGKDSFQIQSILPMSVDTTCYVPTISIINAQPIINLHSTSKPTKQLIYKFNQFIEYNPNPKKYDIEKIEYSLSVPDNYISYFISISNDRTASYMLDSTHFKTAQLITTHQHKTKINLTTYQELIALLNYIDFPHLKNKYDSVFSHYSSAMITITYNNGKTKIIEDNSLDEPNGLAALHGKLFDLRFNQDWIKTE